MMGQKLTFDFFSGSCDKISIVRTRCRCTLARDVTLSLRFCPLNSALTGNAEGAKSIFHLSNGNSIMASVKALLKEVGQDIQKSRLDDAIAKAKVVLDRDNKNYQAFVIAHRGYRTLD